ncbi:MAG: succinate dehydrogenase, cytochrome b556 subunit [Alphaproteobacteria bacterium]|nr:succinate dehydrogenase, cytochrome b556 subunit [Alphaproteobacteria bacterium]
MADIPQTPPAKTRPLSPHLTIYRWPVTMMTSITHRATGIAMAVGMLILAWWLVSISNGPEGFDSFHAVMDTPLGLLVLFGLTWSLAFHLCNGIRHLAWDLGYGFSKPGARQASIVVIAVSLVVAFVIFAIIWTGNGGYLR